MAEFKSGFVALIGLPNAGKSTLMNTVVGAKVSIVAKKPQTTRNRISGVITKRDYQMIFVDTPGIHESRNKLDDYMQKVSQSAVNDVDVVLFIVDARNWSGERELEIYSRLRKQKVPYIVAVNKIDAVTDSELTAVMNAFDTNDQIMLISARTGQGIDELVAVLQKYLVPGPKYYPDDMISDQPLNMMLSETIREKALKHLGKEIPHGIGVIIQGVSLNGENGVTEVEAVIYCERESHKGIVIGKGGMRLKKISTEARQDMEDILEGKVYLRVWVKVREDWRNENSVLKSLGYTEQ